MISFACYHCFLNGVVCDGVAKEWEIPSKCSYCICSLEQSLTSVAAHFIDMVDYTKTTAADVYSHIQVMEAYVQYLQSDKMALLKGRREKLAL